MCPQAKLWRQFFSMIICGLFSCQATHAFEKNYLPLHSNIISHRIRQRLLADTLQNGQTLDLRNCKIDISGKVNLQLHGIDDNGKPWSVLSHLPLGAASVWTRDLDQNGKDDLIFLFYTGQDGCSPPNKLLVIMFEKNGRPMPWLVDGYFEIDRFGIKDFLDLNANGRAELVRQSLDKGYWITSFYESKNCRWSLLKKLDSYDLPMYTKFTKKPNQNLAAKPKDKRMPFEADLGNCKVFSIAASYLDKLYPGASSSTTLVFSNRKRACLLTSQATMFCVIDGPHGRQAVSLSQERACHRLLDEIIQRRLPVTISGNRLKDELACELIYASIPSNAATHAPFASATKKQFSRNLDSCLAADSELP